MTKKVERKITVWSAKIKYMSRGDRTHIGHCTTLDRVGKNSKNDFKN
jgi:hypothetical protein